MTNVFARQAEEFRAKGEALIRKADYLLCQSWNERMWADGEPIDPSPTIEQAVNAGFPWLEIERSRCKTPNNVDLQAIVSADQIGPPRLKMATPAGCQRSI